MVYTGTSFSQLSSVIPALPDAIVDAMRMIAAMKYSHLAAIVVSAVLVVSCGGSTAVVCTQSYWNGEIGTCLPDGWHVLERDNLDDRGVPEEAIVAFQTDESIGGQYLTVVVLREDLRDEVSSGEYSEAGAAAVQTLPGYARLDERSVTIDDAPHILHVFTAQPSDTQPVARFYQLSMAKGRVGYSFTAATPVSIDDSAEDRIVAILTNARLQPLEGETEAASSEETEAD